MKKLCLLFFIPVCLYTSSQELSDAVSKQVATIYLKQKIRSNVGNVQDNLLRAYNDSETACRLYNYDCKDLNMFDGRIVFSSASAACNSTVFLYLKNKR